MAESWRPNWRKSSAYPLRLTDAQWRWEFLRRSDDYKADFELYHESYVARMVDEFKGTPPPQGVESWDSHFRGTAKSPDFCAKYGVKYLQRPADPKPHIGLFVRST